MENNLNQRLTETDKLIKTLCCVYLFLNANHIYSNSPTLIYVLKLSYILFGILQ